MRPSSSSCAVLENQTVSEALSEKHVEGSHYWNASADLRDEEMAEDYKAW